jgi:hypothetical protein
MLRSDFDPAESARSSSDIDLTIHDRYSAKNTIEAILFKLRAAPEKTIRHLTVHENRHISACLRFANVVLNDFPVVVRRRVTFHYCLLNDVRPVCAVASARSGPR